jgi:hypothetical protein
MLQDLFEVSNAAAGSCLLFCLFNDHPVLYVILLMSLSYGYLLLTIALMITHH